MRLLPVDDPHVKSDLAKIEKAQSSFPSIMLVRGDLTTEDVELEADLGGDSVK